MMPYDASLTLLILALYIFTRTNSTFLLGVFSSFSFLTYPSYFYYLLPIPFLIFVFSKPRILKSSMFCIGFAIPIFLAQLFSLVIGASPTYFEEARHLSGIVTQGDFMSSLSFLTDYVRSYDGVWGIVIIAFAPFTIFLKEKRKFLPLMIYSVLMFLILEIFSHTAAKTVLYGRTIRPFYLLLLISGTITLGYFLRKLSKNNLTYTLAFGVFLFISLLNWWPRFNTFKDLVYPSGFRLLAENYLQPLGDRYILEDLYTKKERIDDNATDPPITSKGKFYLVNPTLLYPYYGSLSVPCDAEVLIERDHALLFKPYNYEGFTSQMRGYLNQELPKYQLIYCKL